MAGNIRIDPDTMDSRGSEFEGSVADEINQSISHMDNLLNQLQSEWEGEASRAYADRYTSELKPSFQKGVELAQEIGAALHKTANTMREQDAAIASGFKG